VYEAKKREREAEVKAEEKEQAGREDEMRKKREKVLVAEGAKRVADEKFANRERGWKGVGGEKGRAEELQEGKAGQSLPDPLKMSPERRATTAGPARQRAPF
jgi:hypothetical protein